jgi:hypothetical protein
MQINIHWGEFCGPVNRTEVEMTAITKQIKNPGTLYKYEIDLRGYLPFALFKNIQTKQWLPMEVAIPHISKQVIFYTKKFVDEYEDKL